MSETCPVCEQKTKFIWETQILKKYSAKFFECPDCEYVFAAKPNWLEAAYSDAIADMDTGILVRNSQVCAFVSIWALAHRWRLSKFLDYSGGYGILTRSLRDAGLNAYWWDPIAPNLLARGFQGTLNSGVYKLATAIECFEHFQNPKEHLKKIFETSENLLISTSLIPNPTPGPLN